LNFDKVIISTNKLHVPLVTHTAAYWHEHTRTCISFMYIGPDEYKNMESTSDNFAKGNT